MIEFIQKEVWVMEEKEVDRTWLLTFFLNDHRNDLVVLNKDGKFSRLLNYNRFLFNSDIAGSYVSADKNIFAEAELFYRKLANRAEFLPVLNECGEIVSLLRWNTQVKYADKPYQEEEVIESAECICINSCNMVSYDWLCSYLDNHHKKRIFLDGEGWEVLLNCLLNRQGDNEIMLCSGNDDFKAVEITWQPERRNINTIKSVYRLKDEYYSKRLYIYPYNKDGLDLFVRLGFSGIIIEGFCDELLTEEQTFLNMKAVPLNNIVNDEDVIILYLEDDYKRHLRDDMGVSASKIQKIWTILEVCEKIRTGKNIIFYDSEKEAKRIYEEYEKNGIEIYGSVAAPQEKNKTPLFLISPLSSRQVKYLK